MRITILPENQAVEASHGVTILEALTTNKVRIDHSCGGMGSCGTCRVHIVSGAEGLANRTEIEQEMAQDRGFTGQERLACQTVLLNTTVELVLQR